MIDMKSENVIKLFVNGATSGISERGTVAIVKGQRDIVDVKRTFLYVCNTPIAYRVWDVSVDKFYIVDTPISRTINKYKEILKAVIKEYASTFEDTVVNIIDDVESHEKFKHFIESLNLYTGKL